MNKQEIKKEIEKTKKQIEKDIREGRNFLVKEKDYVAYFNIICNNIVVAKLQQRIDDEKEFKKHLEIWKENQCCSCSDSIKFPDGTEFPESFIFDDNDWEELLSQLEDDGVKK